MSYVEFSPPGHPGIGIWHLRCGGSPCLKGTRLPAEMIALRFTEAGYEGVREYWGYNGPLTDEMIDGAVAWCADPDRKRVHRNAIRRQQRADDNADFKREVGLRRSGVRGQ